VELLLTMALRLHIPFFFNHASRVAAAVSATCFSVSLVAALALIQQHDRLSHRKDPDEVVSSHQLTIDETKKIFP
jgi:hypothetical protein